MISIFYVVIYVFFNAMLTIDYDSIADRWFFSVTQRLYCATEYIKENADKEENHR